MTQRLNSSSYKHVSENKGFTTNHEEKPVGKSVAQLSNTFLLPELTWSVQEMKPENRFVFPLSERHKVIQHVNINTETGIYNG